MILLTSDGLTSLSLMNLVKTYTIDNNYKKAAIVVNANKRFKKKADSWIELQESLESLNLEVELFDYDTDNISILESSDLIVLGGGNPFYLLLKMKEYNMESFLKEHLKAGKGIIGISGGSLVLQESLALIDVFAPDMNMRHGGDLKGLGLVNIEMLPHKRRYTENFKDFKKRVENYENNKNIEAILLEDGDGILIDQEVKYIKGENK